MKNYKKVLNKIGILYVAIISSVNYLGFLLASSGQMPKKQTYDYDQWLMFMGSHTALVNFLGGLSFVIPAILCFIYIFACDEKKSKKRIINIPIFYSVFGILGWVLSFITQSIILVFAKKSLGIDTRDITINSLLNISQASIFIFTLGFLILYTFNRNYVLPRVFPDENIMLIKGAIKPSVRLLFGIFYFSVGIFPIFFCFSTLFNASEFYQFKIENGIYIVIAFFIISGIVMMITFSSFFDYPLKKIKEGTERVKAGIYTEKINVVSNDSFGDVVYTFNEMTTSLEDKTKRILAIQDSVIKGMAVMVESRDNSTGGHINRTSDCVQVFAEKLRNTEKYAELPESFYRAVIKAAPMHDLGKIAVDDAILRKPGRFTDEEYEIMKKHSAEGARIVENVIREVDDEEFKKIAVNVAHYHHEKWDGNGYPEKLKGEQIPLEARIMALADVFDALVSKRCYKDSFSYDKAFQIIEESLGVHFDPELGKVFVECRGELEALYRSY